MRHASGVEAVSRLANGSDTLAVERVADVALVTVSGPILTLPPFLAAIVGSTSVDAIGRALVAAEQSDAARIVVSISSPGGAIGGIDELHALIASSPKPVDVHAAGLLASAAYWAFAAARSISVSPATFVGSIGVRGRAPAKPDGQDVVSRGAPRKLGTRRDAQTLIDAAETVMVDQVAAGRGVRASEVRSRYGAGALFVGSAALEAGLVDAIGTLDSVIAGNAGATTTRTTAMHRPTPARRTVAPVPAAAPVAAAPTEAMLEAADDALVLGAVRAAKTAGTTPSKPAPGAAAGLDPNDADDAAVLAALEASGRDRADDRYLSN